MDVQTLLVPLLIAALFTYLATPIFITRLYHAGITGVDVHKPEKPTRAEMGGIVSLTAILLATPSLAVLQADRQVFPALTTLLLIGLVGVADDTVGIRQRYKPFLIAAATTPLALTLTSTSSLLIPTIGTVEFSYAYPLLLVPLGIATASNLTNMCAGFNGLEIGMGTMALLPLTILSAYNGYWPATLVGGILLATFIPFLRYNWYPAKVFPGDTGTLLVGAGVATVSIMSHLEIVGIITLIPTAIDFSLKMVSKRSFRQRLVFGDTKVGSDRVLHPAPYPALSHSFMRLASITEKQLVLSMLTMQAAYSILGTIIGLAFT